MVRPYPGFTKLNDRRHALIRKKFSKTEGIDGVGLSKDEERELDMLQTVVGAMVSFKSPTDLSRLEAILHKSEGLAIEISKKLKGSEIRSRALDIEIPGCECGKRAKDSICGPHYKIIELATWERRRAARIAREALGEGSQVEKDILSGVDA